VDVGLHHHRQQRPVDPAAGLQQGGEEGALAQLGDLELDIARLGRQQPRPRAVAVGGTASAALIAAGADPLGSLGLDQRLQHQGEALADDVEVTAGTQRIQQISNGRLVQGHRGELLGVNLGGNTLSFTRWPLALLVSRARACPQSPPLPGTLTAAVLRRAQRPDGWTASTSIRLRYSCRGGVLVGLPRGAVAEPSERYWGPQS
jgi:hypothetical protein